MKYHIITIEKIKPNYDWFIVRFKPIQQLQFTGKKFHHSKFILLGKDELTNILVNGVDPYLENTMITIYRSRKAIIDHYSREPYYKHVFTDMK